MYDDSHSQQGGPDHLPDPDPRIAGGFGQPPVRVDRHPAGTPEGGRFR